jgi:hypothetical protein
VPGTHGWRGQLTGEWWCPDSEFWDFLRARGFRPIGGMSYPFAWSTDLNGHRFWRRLLGSNDWHSDWEAGGRALYYYLRPYNDLDDRYTPIDERNIVAHSHGLQVVLKACAMGLKINSLISVMSPVREDMRADAMLARPNIARWLCLHSDHSDATQRRGSWFDGALGVVRAHPLADRAVSMPGMGHSKVIRDPECFDLWDEKGCIHWLREGNLSVKLS